MSEALAVQDHQQIATVSDALSVDELVGQVKLIQQAMSAAMRDGEHFGVIPGTEKPTLLKPGAEKLCLLFRLDPEYESIELREGEHYTVTATCRLFHIPTGNRVASGQGLCSTRESKYAYRNMARTCPACGAEAIIKGKKEYGGGWLCWKKKDGCGAKYDDGDEAIESQEVGQKLNENLPDTYNTVLKMACKRALVAAVLNGTAASDIFTQDLDDRDESLSESEVVTQGARPADTNTGATGQTSDSESAEARKIAKDTVVSALKHAKEHGSLPPGHDDWDAYLKWHIEGAYKLPGAKDWRKKLSIEQMNELAAHLLEQDIPL